jgi:uncharacterized protein (TIGR00730 family)
MAKQPTMQQLNSITVFCGSSLGHDPVYKASADALGPTFKQEGIGQMVYGGGSTGLMGAIADSCIAAGVNVVGVQPGFLDAMERSHKGLTELHVVPSMHVRKQMMADRADGFISLPGGIGTLEELCEIFTWGQLGLHTKPFGLLNVNRYYDHLISFFDQMLEAGFQRPQYRKMILVDSDLASLLHQMRSYQAPPSYVTISPAQL